MTSNGNTTHCAARNRSESSNSSNKCSFCRISRASSSCSRISTDDASVGVWVSSDLTPPYDFVDRSAQSHAVHGPASRACAGKLGLYSTPMVLSTCVIVQAQRFIDRCGVARARSHPHAGSPASLERGDHLVREEPHSLHYHLTRDRGRPVDLEHDLVGAKVLPEHRNPVDDCFRGPKQVDFRRRIGAGG